MNQPPYEPQPLQGQQPQQSYAPRGFRLTKFRIVVLAALCGALVHQVKHWNDPPKPSTFDPLTSKGSLYETLEKSRKSGGTHNSLNATLNSKGGGAASFIPNKEQEQPSVVPLFDAAQKGDTTKVLGLLRAGLPVNARDNQRRTPLMIAAYHGQTEVCKQLLAAKASVSVQDHAGFNPLDYAAARGQAQLVALLLQYKDGGDTKNYSDYAALMAAANAADPAQLPKLSDRSILNRISAEDKSALHIAAGKGAAAVATALLDMGANPNVENSLGQTPLHWAAWNGKLELAALLLDRKANINAQDRAGNTPLHFAIKGKRAALVEQLIARGGKTDIANLQGETAEKLLSMKKQ